MTPTVSDPRSGWSRKTQIIARNTQNFKVSVSSSNLGGIRYGAARVSAKFFSFRNCRVILAGSESYVVSNYPQHFQEELCGEIKLINFVIFCQNFFFLCVQALRR